MRSYTWLVLAATLIGGETGVRSAVGVVERASLNSGGVEGDNFSVNPAVSPGGRFVAFESDSIGLVPGDTNAARDVFVRDTCRGAPSGCAPSTIRVSRSSGGAQANSYSLSPAISADGRFVAFESEATNLVTGDTNERRDVFLRDTCAGASPGCTPGTTPCHSHSAVWTGREMIVWGGEDNAAPTPHRRALRSRRGQVAPYEHRLLRP